MFQNIKVKDFKKILLEKLDGYDNFEITSIGKVQGKADGLINPFVWHLKDSTRNEEKDIFLPSFQDEVPEPQPTAKEKTNEQTSLSNRGYTIQLQLKKETNDGTFFRFSVVNQANEEKAVFWFEKSNNGDIYAVYARFTDKRYSWIQLYIDVDYEETNKFYPTKIYILDTNHSIKMTADQCRDIITYFTEANDVCNVITKFFKKGAIK